MGYGRVRMGFGRLWTCATGDACGRVRPGMHVISPLQHSQHCRPAATARSRSLLHRIHALVEPLGFSQHKCFLHAQPLCKPHSRTQHTDRSDEWQSADLHTTTVPPQLPPRVAIT